MVIVDTLDVMVISAPPPAVGLIELVWIIEVEVLILSQVAVLVDTTESPCSGSCGGFLCIVAVVAGVVVSVVGAASDAV